MKEVSRSFTIFFTTDVHGSDRCFRKFVNAAQFYGADAIILGGDLTGKAVIPVVEQTDGTYRAEVSGHATTVPRQDLDSVLGEIRFNGQYPFVTTPGELAAIESEPGGVHRLFSDAITESLEAWVGLAGSRLQAVGVKVYMSPGNDDDEIVEQVLNRNQFVINPDGQVVEVAPGITMMSFGYSNPTPWNSPRELPEDELKGRLDSLAAAMPSEGVSIYNLHVPPKDTIIDQAARLDANLKPVVQGGQVSLVHVGSRAVREVITEYQPTVGLHGHIHESAGVVRLGKTICINPGSEYNDGILRGALLFVDAAKGKVSYQLTIG